MRLPLPKTPDGNSNEAVCIRWILNWIKSLRPVQSNSVKTRHTTRGVITEVNQKAAEAAQAVQGMQWKGGWDADTDYIVGDVVSTFLVPENLGNGFTQDSISGEDKIAFRSYAQTAGVFVCITDAPAGTPEPINTALAADNGSHNYWRIITGAGERDIALNFGLSINQDPADGITPITITNSENTSLEIDRAQIQRSGLNFYSLHGGVYKSISMDLSALADNMGVEFRRITWADSLDVTDHTLHVRYKTAVVLCSLPEDSGVLDSFPLV